MTTTIGSSLSQVPGLALGQRLRRAAVVMVVLCTGIALLLTAIKGRGLGVHLIYSFSIGICCWLLSDGVRLALMWSIEHYRLRRGLPLMSDEDSRSSWLRMLPLIVAAAVVGPMAGMDIAGRITGHGSPDWFQFASPDLRANIAFAFLASMAAMFAFTTIERLLRARAATQAAQRLAAENQLRLLESQLQPHMLFNTLANLRVLIALDPPRAQAMLDRLISFLRATLNASRVGTHSLQTEFDRIHDYLTLMGIRMGHRLEVVLDLPPALRAAAVPPLLLQPLVENCIQHGLEPKVEGGCITVRAWVEPTGQGLGADADGGTGQGMSQGFSQGMRTGAGTTLHLAVRDNGIGLPAPARGAATSGTGFGTQQVRSRLHTLYGAAAALVLQPAAGGGTEALIRLPLRIDTGTTTSS